MSATPDGAPPADRALLLDRDGTICEEVGYLDRPERLRLIPGSAEAIRIAAEAGFRNVVVTNQSGIARGLVDEATVARIHRRLVDRLAEEHAPIDAVYCCPHHPEHGPPGLRRRCDCRKPRPGLLEQAARDLGLDLQASYAVGDRLRDVEAGACVGAKTVLVRTGYGEREIGYHANRDGVRPDHVAVNLLDAVRWIVSDAPPAATACKTEES